MAVTRRRKTSQRRVRKSGKRRVRKTIGRRRRSSMRGGMKTGLLAHVTNLKQTSRKSHTRGEDYTPENDPSHEAAMQRAEEEESELRELRKNAQAEAPEVKIPKKSSSHKQKELTFSEQQRANEMEYYLNNP